MAQKDVAVLPTTSPLFNQQIFEVVDIDPKLLTCFLHHLRSLFKLVSSFCANAPMSKAVERWTLRGRQVECIRIIIKNSNE